MNHDTRETRRQSPAGAGQGLAQRVSPLGRAMGLCGATLLFLILAACGWGPGETAGRPVATEVTPPWVETPAATSARETAGAPTARAVPAQRLTTPTPTQAPAEETVKGLSEAQAASLRSLQQVDDYPLYTMHLYGTYPTRSSSGAVPSVPWACSLFAALGEAEGMRYGRNFDWDYSPALLLFAHPPDGYASVSMVDLAYLFERNQVGTLIDLPLAGRAPLLEAVYWPFDGMNEHGLTIGMAAVPGSDMPHDPGLETIGSLGIIREMLDHARDVDEAVEILGSYNLSMEGGPSLHYLIADRSGRAVLVEFSQGRMQMLPNEDPWHAATNHLRSQVTGDGDGGCWRYRTLQAQLAGTQGKLSSGEAMSLLQDVSQAGTQWSVVYGISSGEVQVSLGREYGTVHSFDIAAVSP